jgi:sporulation integral membrane protein YtvI
MEIEKRRAFLIQFCYFAVWIAAGFVLLKYGLPLLAPFLIGFLLAALLQRPIRFFAEKLHLPQKLSAILIVLIFYCTVGVLLVLLGIRAIGAGLELFGRLPQLYDSWMAPMLTDLFSGLEQLLERMDPELVESLEDLMVQFTQSVGQLVSDLSVRVVTVVSGWASSLPGLFIKLLLMIISTFFIAADYTRLTGFCMRQFHSRSREIVLQIKAYVVGTLFVCIRSYLLIMTITFVELSIGLTVIGVENGVMIAFGIAVFDILPVLGTGGIMIPWMIIEAIQGDYRLAICLLFVYLIVTVVRNILEPKIVGSQLGLHPVVTLAGMFAGTQLFGIVGLFGVPIGLSLLRYLNENGTIHLFQMKEEPAE